MPKQGRITVRVPRELHRRAKAKAALQDTTLSDLVRKWVTDWLKDDLSDLNEQTQFKVKPSVQ